MYCGSWIYCGPPEVLAVALACHLTRCSTLAALICKTMTHSLPLFLGAWFRPVMLFCLTHWLLKYQSFILISDEYESTRPPAGNCTIISMYFPLLLIAYLFFRPFSLVALQSSCWLSYGSNVHVLVGLEWWWLIWWHPCKFIDDQTIYIRSSSYRYMKLGMWNRIDTWSCIVVLLWLGLKWYVLLWIMIRSKVVCRAWFDDVAPPATITQSHHM